MGSKAREEKLEKVEPEGVQVRLQKTAKMGMWALR